MVNLEITDTIRATMPTIKISLPGFIPTSFLRVDVDCPFIVSHPPKKSIHLLQRTNSEESIPHSLPDEIFLLEPAAQYHENADEAEEDNGLQNRQNPIIGVVTLGDNQGAYPQ